jgi:DNA replication and repair protein RecF
VLTEFRSWRALVLPGRAGLTVLVGPNGAGKTNVLEGLSYLAPGRGLRGARATDVRSDTAPQGVGWAVAARLATASGSIDIGTGAEGARRQVRIDGKTARGQAGLAATLGLAWLTPAMDRLFLDGAKARRRFLDRLVFGHDPCHADRLNAYDRALAERARLLRDGPRDQRWLAALEAAIAQHGVALAASRREVVERLDTELAHAAGPFPSAHVAVEGTVERWLEREPAIAVEERFAARLAVSRASDAATGTDGPNRSDLIVRHRASGRSAAFCSTGEQKALLVALVLADARILARGSLGAPILLLDDVAAHLDEAHRVALFAELERLGGQAWLSGTDPESFRALQGRGRFLAVERGAVREAGA